MIGQTISHYKIAEKLGEGGMGVVYKAEDTKLERTVALKFLAGHLLNDEEAKARFLREAKAAAGLHHPNICPVYEIGEAERRTFLSMAFIEGEPLEDRIERGPPPLKDALDIGRQIAEGLEAAHDKGVVHRDIKPANVMVDAKGRATIMDFGLARLTEASRLTKADQTMGTAAYMSPEQAQGMDIDGRTDIWALGVVLYEMVRGQRPFQGEYNQALLFEIVHQEPEPLTGVRTGVPPELELLVTKCLAKDAQDRYGHADEIAKDLRTLGAKLESGRSTILVPDPGGLSLVPRRKLVLFQGLLALSVLCGIAALATMYFQRPPTLNLPVRRFEIPSPADFPALLTQARTAISPDGKHIAFVTGGEDGRLWIHSLDQFESRPIEGAEGAASPFWAPDSESVAFAKDRELWRVRVGGGLPVPLCPVPGYLLGGTWSPDGEVIAYSIFMGERGSSIFQVPAGGGSPSSVIAGSPGRGVSQPHFLPIEAGTRVLVYASGSRTQRNGTMIIEDLNGGRLGEIPGGHYPFYSPSGHVVYEQPIFAGKLWALPFSLTTLTATGEPFAIVENGHAGSISSDGTLVYVPSSSSSEHELVWVDRHGARIEGTGLTGTVFSPALSPDGQFVAFQDASGNVGMFADVRVYNLVRGTEQRLTSDPETESAPVWSHDGRYLAFSSNTGSGWHILVRPANEVGPESEILGADTADRATDWSRDGRFLLYRTRGTDRSWDMGFAMRNQDDDTWEPHSLLQTPSNEHDARLSPDGRYVAYASDESGRYEVYVQRFPEGGRRHPVSANGGHGIRWRRDGKELFYVQDRTMIAVPVSTSGEFTMDQPERLFEHSGLLEVGPGDLTPYDVSTDGQKFLLAERAEGGSTSAVLRASIHVVQNWYGEFRDRE